MDEFTNIAIWLLIIYLAINSSIIWFAGQDTFVDNFTSIQGLTPNDAFGEADLVIFKGTFFETNCSVASDNPLTYIPCFLGKVATYFNTLAGQIWGLLTAWSNLLGAILPGIIGSLVKEVIGPIFGGIAFVGFFVILLRVAGIIRGGS